MREKFDPRRLLKRPSATDDALRAELEEVRRKLRQSRREVKRLTGDLRWARGAIREGTIDLPDDVHKVIAQVQEERLTFLRASRLSDLAALVLDLDRRGIPGLVIEAGTARGGSAITMAAAKAPERPMRVYDVFAMIPPPSTRDGEDVHERYATIAKGEAKGKEGDVYYGYRSDLLTEVTESFERHGVPLADHHVELVAGLFDDTLHVDEPVAFAHLDGDWYESTMTCLQRIAPHVVPGGRIVLDDYYAWSGCRDAVDDYFRTRDDFRLEFRARVHAIRR